MSKCIVIILFHGDTWKKEGKRKIYLITFLE